MRGRGSPPAAALGSVAVVALGVGALGPVAVEAQLAEASAATLALSGAHTATVRGFGALGVNPAGLDAPGPGLSFALVPVRARAGSGPVTLSDFAEYEDRLVPTPVKEAWLSAIRGAGGQSALAGLDVSGFALAVDRFGLQVSTTTSARVHVPPDVAEAVLFGNAGRAGVATALDLTGFRSEAFATTTAGLGGALPLGPLTVGVTVKYTLGHGLAVARARSGAISSEPIRITLETSSIAPCDDEVLGGCRGGFGKAGGGFGADVGVRMGLGPLRLGAAVIDAVSGFSWDAERLSHRPGSALVEEGVRTSSFGEGGYDDAPADLRALVEAFGFEPWVRAGAALDVTGDVTVSADIHHRTGGEGMRVGPRSLLGVGAEWRGLRWAHLRAGGGLASGGVQLSGGASLLLGPVAVSVAGALRDHDAFDRTSLAQLTLSYGGW